MSTTDSVQILERYSVVILPVLVVAEQVGVPLPAVPALLAVGALAAKGRGGALDLLQTRQAPVLRRTMHQIGG